MTGRMRKIIIAAAAFAAVATAAAPATANADEVELMMDYRIIHTDWGDATFSWDGAHTLFATDRKADGWAVGVSLQQKVDGKWKAVGSVTDSKKDDKTASKQVTAKKNVGYRLHMWKAKGSTTSSHQYGATFKI